MLLYVLVAAYNTDPLAFVGAYSSQEKAMVMINRNRWDHYFIHRVKVDEFVEIS